MRHSATDLHSDDMIDACDAIGPDFGKALPCTTRHLVLQRNGRNEKLGWTITQ